MIDEKKAIGQFKLQLNGVMGVFDCYGMGVDIPESIKEITNLALQLHGLFGLRRILMTEEMDKGTYIGLLLQLSGKITCEYLDDELWEMCKEAALAKMSFPYTTELPCGSLHTFLNPTEILNLPIEDMPCPCGNPNHKVIAFKDSRKLKGGNNG